MDKRFLWELCRVVEITSFFFAVYSLDYFNEYQSFLHQKAKKERVKQEIKEGERVR